MATVAPTKPLPLAKQESRIFKSNLVMKVERDQQRIANRLYGEEGFSVEPMSAMSLSIVFPHELPQTPLVFYSIQSASECFNVHSLTARSNSGFQINIHNLSDTGEIMEGVILWHAFVQP